MGRKLMEDTGDDAEIHPPPSGWLRGYVFSRDHKVIARQFLFLGLVFLAVGGFMAMLIRWQLANPGQPIPLIGRVLFGPSGGIISPAAYTSLFTMHGTIMIFFAVTPILIGAFGNLCIPLMIGARDMAFPTLNLMSVWTMAAATATLTASFFVPLGAPQAGWTAYATLSTAIGTPGLGQTLWVVAIYLNGASSIMGAVNYITTIIRFRAPGMTYFRLPLTVWGFLMTSILNALFIPVLAAGMVLLFFDRVFGTTFFIAGSTIKGGGDPILYQHLFWLFGHPEVYILILPAWGIVSDLLSFFARKPAYGYRVTVGALIAITALSSVVYGHHMFVTGMSPLLGESFMVLTMIISVPAVLLFLNWLGTLWRGAMRLHTPMLFSLGLVFTFGIGGLTGLYLADIVADLYLHDTYFVVGHFHLIMAAAVLLAIFAGVYFWFPKMFGRMMNEPLGKLHFWLTIVPLNIVFGGQLVIGYAGMQRRLYDPSVYEFLRHLLPLNRAISHAAFVLGAAQLIFVVNFFWSLFGGKVAAANPWEVGTLEWTVSSPPPHHNFDRIPEVLHGPHELGNPVVRAQSGKDWLAQDEVPTTVDPTPERPTAELPAVEAPDPVPPFPEATS
jgi:cytochrome c oxidase subunit I